MCGIAGIAAVDGACSPRAVETMCALMTHRGPDSGGTHTCQAGKLGAVLGARRLSIRDLSPSGDQPMSSVDGRVTLVYNGELYNDGALREQLRGLGRTFRSHGDTETVLTAYDAWGLEALARLEGMFAVALFDADAGRLVLARDRMGIKPLYVCWDGRTLRFASELKVLLADGAVPRTLDPEAADLYLTFGYVPSPFTLIDGVRKLEPGRALVLDQTGVSGHDFAGWSASGGTAGTNEAGASIADRVDRAVRRQLVSDVPVGVLLSGGLDSSIIALLAAEHGPQPLHTFTAAYRVGNEATRPLGAFNEDSAYARQLAQRLGTAHHEVVLDTALDWEDLLRRLAAQLDEPLFEPVYVVLHLLCAEAQRQGVRVVLTGDGADELFYGYSARYQMPAHAEKYERLPFARQLAAVTARAAPGSRVGRQAAGVRRVLSARTAAQRYLAYSTIFDADDRARLLGYRPSGSGHTAELVVTQAMGGAARRGLTQALAATDLRLWVGEHFNPRLDRISMMHSVEARVPFQDDELIDAFVGLDPSLNLEPGAGKALLRHAFADRLPPDVVRRRKRAFQAPGDTLIRHGARALVSELLSSRQLRKWGVLEPDATEAIVRRALQGGETRSFELWSLIALQLWCEAYLGAAPTAQAA